jgi:hypothetical protein
MKLKTSEKVFQSFRLYFRLPKFSIKITFVIKSVNSIYRRALMVSSEKEEVFGVLYFVCEEQAYALDRLFSTINIISKKEIVCIARKSSVFK